MASHFTTRSAPTFGPRRHRGTFQSEARIDVDEARIKWAQSRTTFRRDAYRVVMRKRTLDEYPMAHSRADTVRMLQQRRADKDAQRRSLECTLGESKNLSSYSRRRFETALHSKRGEAPPLPDDGDRSLFFREVLPPWKQKRHSMSLSPCSELVRLAPRPDSEPPLCPRSSQGRTFDHLRRTSAAYPRIRQLLRNYNNEYRVVCTTPPDACRHHRNSMEVSVGSEFLLVPLLEDQPEDKSEDQLISTLSLLERKADDAGEEAEEKSSSAKGSDVEILEPGQIRTKLIKPEAAPQPGEQEEEEARLGDAEPVGNEGTPSPPWRCWVDDATVSSISRHSEAEALPEDTPASAPRTPVPEAPGPSGGNAVSEAALKMNKLEAKAATSSTEKPPSPMGVGDTPSGKKKSLTKGRRKKEPEPPVEVEPPVVVVEEVQPEVEEVVEEVEEEVVEPVLPPYICPSSEVKSHQTETKLWLRKSTFSAANRSVPIF